MNIRGNGGTISNCHKQLHISSLTNNCLAQDAIHKTGENKKDFINLTLEGTFRRIFRMGRVCCVNGCTKSKKRHPNLLFYKIPTVIEHQGPKTKELSTLRRDEWLKALIIFNIGKNVERLRVCSSHFVSGKFHDLYRYIQYRKLLGKKAFLYCQDDPDWVPSISLNGPDPGT